MPDDLLTESPADVALQDAIRTESEPPPEADKTPETLVSEPNTVSDKPNTAPEPSPEAKKPDTHVPLATFLEEREARKRFERELAEARKPTPAPELDETQDPIGTIGALRQKMAEYENYQRQQQEDLSYGQRAQAAVNEYVARDPSYNEAAMFLQQVRARQLESLPHIPRDQIGAMIQAEAKILFKSAIDNGANPAEVVVAQARAVGWQPKTGAAPSPVAVPVPAPAAPAPAPAPAPVDTKAADERVDRLARGQRAASTSSASGGRATAANELSVDDIAKLDGAAFDAAFTKLLREQKRLERDS